ncbi:SAM-dependent methyltransferase [Methylobacterium variabile]|jgi:SAM-dependent methyltransferase|uniref:SAM-dependent methyltransferase n=1 Tax=Methylobacterium variabile TaxID=298794 RepID=A0A0J6TAM1_9HYPH|nr:class I SAM-dependent methyltransferase [Methylobacterium variabile]KMO42648.1 SAM-dependent methyltransferase [Methylobacterium variabile]
MTTFKDHFSTNNAGYAAHRPTYPPALVEYLADSAPDRALALDAGCGTGQLSTLLAERFAQVVATDASAQQIAAATPHARVTYRTAPAERSGLPEASTDLVTVAQAAHWLDLDPFYAEVRRIARPRAVVALITYGVLHVEDAAADEVAQRFYSEVIGPYWPPERRHVEEGYRALPFPFAPLDAPALDIEVAWRLPDLIGYTETWSAVRAAEKAVGRGPIEAFHAELTEAWGDPDSVRRVRWPLSLRVGRVERP